MNEVGDCPLDWTQSVVAMVVLSALGIGTAFAQHRVCDYLLRKYPDLREERIKPANERSTMYKCVDSSVSVVAFALGFIYVALCYCFRLIPSCLIGAFVYYTQTFGCECCHTKFF